MMSCVRILVSLRYLKNESLLGEGNQELGVFRIDYIELQPQIFTAEEQ